MKRGFLSVLAIFCLVFFIAIPEVSAQKVVKIGGIFTTSGPAAALGKASLNGALLAAEDVNAKGGITVAGEKYKIEIINYDDKCVAKDAVSATERLIRQDKVPVIFVAICSHCTLAAMEITEKEKIPIVTAISASIKVTAMGYKYIFRTGGTAALQIETVSRFAAQDLKKKTMVYIGRNDAWCRSAADEWKLRFEKRGGKVLLTEFYELGTTDFYPQLTKAKNADADLIYFCALAEDGGLLFKQARELGIKAQLTGAPPDEQFIRLAAGATEGGYFYYDAGPTRPQGMDYDQRYKKKYDVESLFTDKVCYDTLMIIANAMERAGTVTDSQKIRDALAKTDFEGIRQRYTFDENGQAKMDMWIVTVEKGKLKFIKAIPVYDNPAAPM